MAGEGSWTLRSCSRPAAQVRQLVVNTSSTRSRCSKGERRLEASKSHQRVLLGAGDTDEWMPLKRGGSQVAESVEVGALAAPPVRAWKLGGKLVREPALTAAAMPGDQALVVVGVVAERNV